jgi:hypothetical protein
MSDNILPDVLKKKWFDKWVAQTSVLVEYSTDESGSFVEVKSFRSVRVFMEQMRRLDLVLSNIIAFFMTELTPDADTGETLNPPLLEEEEKKEEFPLPKPRRFSEVTSTKKLIPTVDKKTEDQLCDICMFTVKETVLPCMHAYCRNCIDEWLAKEPNCPMCREARGSIESYGLVEQHDPQTLEKIRNDLIKELGDILSNIVFKPSEDV